MTTNQAASMLESPQIQKMRIASSASDDAERIGNMATKATKITIAALAALTAEQIAALGPIEVVDKSDAKATKTTDRALVDDATIIGAATSYVQNGKTHQRLDKGSGQIARLDTSHGVVIGTAEGKTRVVRYSTAANGRVYASTVGTYSDEQLTTLAESLMAATGRGSQNTGKGDTATAIAAIAAATRRSHVVDALKSQGIAIPNDVTKYKVSDLRAWAIDAVTSNS